MKTYVVDIETDGLISSRIHVMSVGYKDIDGEWQIKSTSNHDDIIKVMTDPDNTIIGHNFKAFDAVEIERVLDIKVTANIVDTLALAWYIYPTRTRGTFGLADFGVDYGIPKPKIDDWEGLTYEDYKHRCEEDVKINIKVWEDIQEKLLELYTPENCVKFIKYLMFKMECVAKQRQLGCKVDLDMVNRNIGLLEALKEPKIRELIKVMPLGNVIKTKPKIMYKKDKSISSNGQKWFDYLRENKLPLTDEEVREDANPSSNNQLKKWLLELGWKPETFKDGKNGPVPQVRNDKKQLCDSVLKLLDKEPAIEQLDGLTVINHRLGVLNSFLDNTDEEGYTIASMNGFTNTLRLKHSKPIANLPGVTGKINKAIANGMTRTDAIANNLRDGQIIRECVIAPKGYELCGSDISSLEDMCKRHYMWDYDSDYVTEQMEEGFDPHLDLALRAGAITEEQLEEHKLYSKSEGVEGVSHKEIRDAYKQANYSCIYGIGAPKLSKATGLTIRETKSLIKTYWDRNWSIRQLPKDITIKRVGEQMWLLNPVSGFYYSVRSEKDIFSTLNQGTGSFVFDCWVKLMMNEGITPFLQYHDEVLALVPKKKGERDKYRDILDSSMATVNDILKLNVEITVDVQFGKTYADVH